MSLTRQHKPNGDNLICTMTKSVRLKDILLMGNTKFLSLQYHTYRWFSSH